MGLSSVKIVIRNNGTGDGSGVEVDGIRIPSTHAVGFRNEVGKPTSVMVELWAKEITVDVDGALVTLTPDLIYKAVAATGIADTTEMGMGVREYTRVSDDDLYAIASRVADILGQRAAVRAKL